MASAFFALAYLLIVKPSGTLTVTYERRTASLEEKTCPNCAERIKAAALVCHFCGHKFTPEDPAEEQRNAAVRRAPALEQQKLEVDLVEVNGHVYRSEEDGSVSAVNSPGERIKFPN